MRESVDYKVCNNERLNRDEARWLLSDADLWDLGRWAHTVRCRQHPSNRVTYQIDRNINYTNVCISHCGFCAFHCPPGHPEGYTLTVDQILNKVSETLAHGGTGILLQGGLNPEIPFGYYIDLLTAIRTNFPTIHVHAYSPPEIISFSRFFSMHPREVLRRLIEAGLDSIPGGGAEILAEPARSRVSKLKCSGKEWLEIMRMCHEMGLKTSATMVIGLGETIHERLEHLFLLRDLQDQTNGFTAFIPWTFQPGNTRMTGQVEPVGGIEYLRLQAAARLILDNISHHQVSVLTQGIRLGTFALYFGADDFSSVMLEENVVAAAGTVVKRSESQTRHLIDASGFRPVKRLSLYQNILHG
jgi:cyclic dehypoxanthinyl futalosine synthase